MVNLAYGIGCIVGAATLGTVSIVGFLHVWRSRAKARMVAEAAKGAAREAWAEVRRLEESASAKDKEFVATVLGEQTRHIEELQDRDEQRSASAQKSESEIRRLTEELEAATQELATVKAQREAEEVSGLEIQAAISVPCEMTKKKPSRKKKSVAK